ncbi:MAG: VOC family protein [Actinomycetota bacterium]
MAFHPYLYLDGNCRAAFTRYHEIFGGDLVIMTGHDAPPDAGIPEDKVDLVMHAALTIGDDLLMASDNYDDGFSPMAAVFVHYSTKDLDDARAVFDGLGAGGTIHQPGHEEFWTPFFGSCTDEFGVQWQVSVEMEPEAAG